MNILYICHRFPFPPKRGGKIRPFNVIKHLSKMHKVTVASLARSDAEAKAGAGLRDFCHNCLVETVSNPSALANMLMRVPTHIPFSMGYFYSQRLYDRIQRETVRTRFDLIFVHCSSVAQYVNHVTDVPKILDFGDMDSQKWLLYSKFRLFPLNMLYYVEGTRLQREETELARKFDYCTCTTFNEMQTLKSYRVDTGIDWFPNGVDTDYFKPSATPYKPDTICFIGRMDYYPNQECMFDFCKNILPRIKAKRPNAKLTIIGADPPSSVRRLGKIPGVMVTGSVEDVRPYVTESAVNVAPLSIARGTQNKVLEAMSMGVPVVTSVQASGGVDAVPGEHLLTASGHKEFAEAVLYLLSDKTARRKYSEAGRERMLYRHNWERSMKKLDQIIENCLMNVRQRS